MNHHKHAVSLNHLATVIVIDSAAVNAQGATSTTALFKVSICSACVAHSKSKITSLRGIKKTLIIRCHLAFFGHVTFLPHISSSHYPS